MGYKDLKISIIIPVFNTEKYLKECLDSVLCQTYKNYEIICVNDGSTDNSKNILNEYRNKENFVIIDQDNKGLSVARNVGMEKANGEYIMFLDSDDFLEVDALEVLAKNVKNEDIDILSFENNIIFEDEKLKGNGSKEKYYTVKNDYSGIFLGRELFASKVRNNDYIESAWLLFIKKEWINENKIKFIQGALFEDSFFSLECYFKCKKMKHIKEKVYTYRVREASIMTMRPTYKHAYYRLKQVMCCWEYMVTKAENIEEEKALGKYAVQCLNSFKLTFQMLDKNEQMRLLSSEWIVGYIIKILGLRPKSTNVTLELYVEGLKRIIYDANKIIIYGAGMVGSKIKKMVEKLGKEDAFLGYAVSDGQNVEQENVRYIGDYVNNCLNSLLVVAVRESYSFEMTQIAENIGFKNILVINKEIEEAVDSILQDL